MSPRVSGNSGLSASSLLSHSRSWRGRNFNLTIRFTCQVRQSTDDVSVSTHTNETMGCLRARILRSRVGTNGVTQNYRLHLFANSDLIEACEDRRVVTEFGLRDRSMLSAQLVPLAGQNITTSSHIPSSPESTSGSSLGGSPKLMCAGSGQTAPAEQRPAGTAEGNAQTQQVKNHASPPSSFSPPFIFRRFSARELERANF